MVVLIEVRQDRGECRQRHVAAEHGGGVIEIGARIPVEALVDGRAGEARLERRLLVILLVVGVMQVDGHVDERTQPVALVGAIGPDDLQVHGVGDVVVDLGGRAPRVGRLIEWETLAVDRIGRESVGREGIAGDEPVVRLNADLGKESRQPIEVIERGRIGAVPVQQ